MALTAALCCVSMPVYSGDGSVIMLREVPPHSAYRESPLGRDVTIDVSPDDKVIAAVNGHQATFQNLELEDGDFASVSSGSPLALISPAQAMNKAAISEGHMGSSSLLSGGSGGAGSAQSIVPVVARMIGPAVGSATNAIVGVTGTLNGLTDTISRTSGP
jgi:hypothetical protein